MISRIQLLIVLNLLYIIPSTYIFLQRSNIEFLAYLAIVLLLGVIFIRFLQKGYLKLHEMYLLSFWGLLHIMGGLLIFSNGSNLYSQVLINIIDNGGGYVILKMDQVIHMYGFGLAAYIMHRILHEKTQTTQTSSIFIGIFAVIIAIGFGALNEVVEFMVVLLVEFHGVGDLYNMGFDLIFNLAGAILGAGIQYLRLK
ncbi:MAG: hypothetical protein ACLFPL_02740 [Candidatus Nanoarchaeia archaeon]